MIFVTGANGLVGSFIVKQLVKDGYKVKCLKRANSDLNLLSGIENKIEWVEGDILDVMFLQNQLKGVEVVIHSAAIVSFLPSKYSDMLKTNVEGTFNIVNASILNKVEKFIFISSVASLGRTKHSNIINELNVWEESPENSGYAKSKYLSELEVWRGAEEGLKTIIINPSIVLGPGDLEKSSTRIFNYVLEGKIFYPPGEINYVDVRDVADVTIKLLKSNKYNERYILSAGKVSYKEFFEKVANAFGKKSPSIPVSPFFIAVLWRLSKILSFILKREALITKETANATTKTYFYVNDKIKETLGHKFYDLNNTLHWIAGELSQKTQG